MIDRTITRRIVFRHPFRLNGLDGQLAAGTYSIETWHPGMWRRLFDRRSGCRSRIRVCRKHGVDGLLETLAVDQLDLVGALLFDRCRSGYARPTARISPSKQEN